MSDVVSLTVPFPVSLNRYYRKFRNRLIISKDGTAYRNFVEKLVSELPDRFDKTQRLGCIAHLFPSSRRLFDLDNAGKCLLDSLEHGGLFHNDNQIDHLTFVRNPPDKQNPRCEVTLYTLEDN